MDHLDVPLGPVHRPVEVPYVCLEDYDGGTFHDYLGRRNTSLRRLKTLASTDYSVYQSICQSWMFFGLLKSVLGQDVPTGEFIRSPWFGKKSITTSCLPYYADRWRAQYVAADNATRAAEHDRAAQVLNVAGIVLSNLNQGHDLLDRLVLFSFSILHEFLVVTWLTVFERDLGAGRLPPYVGYQRHHFPFSRMLQDKWCPQLLNILKSLPPSLRYYVSLLDRPNPLTEHPTCSESRCVAYEQEVSAYRTKHTNSCSGCEEMVADTEAMYAILRDGSFPVIKLDRHAGSGLTRLSIMAASSVESFVAISHVWSDGLGNPNQNSLPLCQLEALSLLCKKLYLSHGKKGVLEIFQYQPVIWIDTICCPRSPTEARHLAISTMARTYTDAEFVIALDSYLQGFPFTQLLNVSWWRWATFWSNRGRFVIERFIRIYISRWTHRLWTLQEGALADKLIVQFGDTLLSFSDAYFDLTGIFNALSGEWPKELRRIPRVVPRLLNSLYVELRMSAIRNGSLSEGFGDMGSEEWALLSQEYFSIMENAVRALRLRSTTVAEDEALCLASLLGLDARKLVDIEPTERMKKFWYMQPAYSSKWLQWGGRKLLDSGFRWAPASFLYDIKHHDTSFVDRIATRPAKLTKDGLLMNYPGFRLSATLNAQKKKFWIGSLPEGQIFSVEITEDQPELCHSKEMLAPFLLLMTDKSLQEIQTTSHEDYVSGFIMSTTNENDNVIYCSTGPRISLFNLRESRKYATLLNVSLPIDAAAKTSSDSEAGERENPFMATWLEQKQLWCVD